MSQENSESKTVKVALLGTSGRMGIALLQMHNKVPGIEVIGGLVRPHHELEGMDASAVIGGQKLGIPLVSDIKDLCPDVIVDFSRPALVCEILEWCTEHKVPLVTGTTGFSPDELAKLKQASEMIPIVHSGNMSPLVNLCYKLVGEVAELLGDSVDVEIFETHHKHKVDAPSGTALGLGQAIADAWQVPLEERAVYARHGHTGARKEGSIGFSSNRAGDIIADHTVLFASDGERLEITHKSTNRSNYSKGAYLAAKWVIDKTSGYYSMFDVLNIPRP